VQTETLPDAPSLTPQVPKAAANVEEATQPATHTPGQVKTTMHVPPSNFWWLEGYNSNSDDDGDEEEVGKQVVKNNTDAKVVDAKVVVEPRAAFTPMLDSKSIDDFLKSRAGPKVMSMVIAMEGTKRYLMHCVTNV
jgi:hypothetical protein